MPPHGRSTGSKRTTKKVSSARLRALRPLTLFVAWVVRVGRNHPAVTAACTVIATVCTVVATLWAVLGPIPTAAPEAPSGSAVAPSGGLAINAATNPVTAARFTGLEEQGQAAFVFDREPNALDSDTVPTIAVGDPDDAYRWAYASGGVDVRTTVLAITVQGRTEEAIVVTDLRVRVTERRDPLSGYLVVIGDPGGGPLHARVIGVDLDGSVPQIDMRDQSESLPGPSWSFPLQVSSTDPEYFYLLVHATTCDCRWVAEIDYVHQGESETFVVDNGGVPFRTTGTSEVKASYTTLDGRSFTWCGSSDATGGCY